MALVILVRHGQTDENVSGRISGQGPVPLNVRGQEQARLAAEILAPLGITHICSSPLVRARQTAAFLAERLQKPIEEIPDLREVGYGDWEGKTFNEMRAHPVAHQVFNDPINATFPSSSYRSPYGEHRSNRPQPVERAPGRARAGRRGFHD